MAGPRANDSYSPVPTQSTGSMNNNYLTSKATPDSAGAGIGEALQGTSRALGKVIDTKVDYDLQEMGLANEHAANESEIQISIQGGDTDNDFQTLSGLDATNSKDQYIQKYLEVNAKIRDALPNDAARRAYDGVAGRRIAFTIQNMNGYAAREEKKAYREGRVSSIKLSIDRMSRYDVVTNKEQFDFERDNVVFQANTVFTAPKYGIYQTVPFKEDPKTHRLVYDTSTDQGRIAQDNYDNYLNENLSLGYTTAVKTILDDPSGRGGVQKALEFVEANKDQMSSVTHAKVLQSLDNPIKMAQQASITDRVMGQVPNDSDYIVMNKDSILEQVRAEAEKVRPGDLVFQDQTERQVTQRLNTRIRDENQMNTVNSHTVYDYIRKNNISNVSQMMSAPPPVRSAFESYISKTANGYDNVDRVITSRSFSKLSNYGPAFYKNFVKMAKGDFRNVFDLADENQLQPKMGRNSPLTNTGYEVLSGTLQRFQDKDGTLKPEGQAFLQAQAKFLAGIQNRYVGTGDFETNKDFNQYLEQAIPQINAAVEKGMREGKPLTQIATEIFTPQINGKDNINFIRTSVTPPDPLKLAAKNRGVFDFKTAPPPGSPAPGAPKPAKEEVQITKLSDIRPDHKNEDLAKFKAFHKLSTNELIEMLKNSGMLQ